VWLVFDKRRFRDRSISYRDFLCDAVEEAICYGWIDSRVKRIGETKLGARFTPRRSRDDWSKNNRVRALMLFHNGMMTRAGIDVLPLGWATKSMDANKSRNRKIAETVDGIIMDGNKFLVEKRRDDDDADPGFIGVPGGHVEKNETLKGALRREMKEELGIDVTNATFVQRSLYTSTNGERQRIHYFHVEKWTGKIVSKEAERVYWESDVSNLSIIPDRRAVRTILRVQNPSRK
jgi:8-oxo-dGTP diphosphatase